jgi:proline dehydrogenase
MRALLLAASDSAWLRDHAMRWGFVRRATRRFMPGERLEDALEAGAALAHQGIGTLLTRLGENLSSAEDAALVTEHYLGAQDDIRSAGIPAETSIKLTQLGLDQDRALARDNLVRLARHAAPFGKTVWVDMEGSAYTDVTFDLYRDVRREHSNVGVALQSYLRRARADLETLIPLGASVRLVKGAYREPPTLAFPTRRQVDESYFELATRLLSAEARSRGVFAGFGTHDEKLIERIQHHAQEQSIPKDAFEFEMLFGIRRDLQARLVGDGYRLRVLISYGDSWFPWYMRRLAERPANLWFLLRNLFGG